MGRTWCCMRLQTAGLVIGIFHLTVSLMAIVSLMSFYINNYYYSFWQIWTNRYENLFFELMICVVPSFIVSGLLVLGTLKKRAALLLPWLVFVFIYESIMMVGTIAAIYRTYIWDGVLVLIAFRFMEMYIYYAIYSLYREMKASSEIKPYHTHLSVEAVSDL